MEGKEEKEEKEGEKRECRGRFGTCPCQKVEKLTQPASGAASLGAGYRNA
jgi:hypothetical protein